MKKRLKREYKSSDGYNRVFRKQFLKDFVKENTEARKTYTGLQKYITTEMSQKCQKTRKKPICQYVFVY
ncbi:hypothetical protein SLS58_006731 [Diplodia intermedia]|uniref:Uncharacterized protein n=1 Tax=Diplodia intermedia TaxID=856260 RepID=A0ABR3TN32_9PEZI